MSEPKIIMEDWQGRHNASDYAKRLEESKSYRDLSTICIVPTRGVVAARVVQNWMGMIGEENINHSDNDEVNTDFIAVDRTIHPADDPLAKWNLHSVFNNNLESPIFVNAMINLDSD